MWKSLVPCSVCAKMYVYIIKSYVIDCHRLRLLRFLKYILVIAALFVYFVQRDVWQGCIYKYTYYRDGEPISRWISTRKVIGNSSKLRISLVLVRIQWQNSGDYAWLYIASSKMFHT